jgi:hypothetical protein
MSIQKPSEQELRDHYFIFDNNKPRELGWRPKIEPVRLADKTVDDLLKTLRPFSTSVQTDYIRQKISEAAEYYWRTLWEQTAPSPAKALTRLTKVQNAAKVLTAHTGSQSRAADRLDYHIQSYLLSAADEYGQQVGKPEAASQEIPWMFWSRFRLPSAITSVALIEHLAGLAKKQIEARVQLDGRKTKKASIANRVLIDRLALVWMSAKGSPPPDDSVLFYQLASRFVLGVEARLTPQHRRLLPTIQSEIEKLKKPNVVRWHLRRFLLRLEEERERRDRKLRTPK